MSLIKDFVFQLLTPHGILDLRLGVNQSLVLGRSENCSIKINDPSVSGEHLKLTWTGKELVVEDLDSSNGVFANSPLERIQKSAFLISELSNFELRLSSTVLVTIKASASPETRYSQVKTEVLGAKDPTSFTTPDAVTKTHKGEAPKDPLSPIPNSHAQKISSVAQESKAIPPLNPKSVNKILSKDFDSLVWVLRVGISVVALALIFWFWKALYQDMWSFQNLNAQTGFAFDLLFLHLLSMPKWLPIIVGIVFVALVFMVILPSLLKQFSLKSVPSIQLKKIWAKRMIVFFLVLGVFSPFGLAHSALKYFSHVVGLAKIYAQTRTVHLHISKSAGELTVLSQGLEKLRGPLQGSSVGFLLSVQIDRGLLLHSCEGTGITKGFDLKKPCLIELTRIYKKQNELWSPQVIAEASSDMVLLASLDTMVSLLAQDSSDPTKDIESLALELLTSGFLKEGDQYVRWIQDPRLDRLAKYAMLQGERRKVEGELLKIIKTQKLPAPLIPVMPSPLELGL